MQFTTPIPIEKQPVGISHDNRIMLIGSCFTENIGNRLEYNGFQTLVNPCGILYNPVSIAKCLELTLSGKEITDSDLVFGNGLWHSWLHHGKFSHPDKAICLQQCNTALRDAHSFLKSTDTLILTLGTAFVYELENGNVAANCHKMPGTLFHKRMTTVEELAAIYNTLIDRLMELSNDIRILFTVSPIRHWKDGYRQNTLSKAVLHLLVDELQKTHSNVFYFPAYEIVMDELRDYRFYSPDMLHPSAQAVEYIWERLVASWFSNEAKAFLEEWRPLKQALNHRPFDPYSEDYKTFMDKTMLKVEALRKKYSTFAL